MDTHASFTARIRANMPVVGADGSAIGTVDAVEGDEIKLTRDSSADGEHSYVPISLVEAVEEDRVVVRSRNDNAFGVAAG